MYTVDQLCDPVFREEVMDKGTDLGNVNVKFDDGVSVEMRTRMAMLHGILWSPLRSNGLSVTLDDVYAITAITPGVFATIQSKQYRRILLNTPGMDHLPVCMDLFQSINALSSFIIRNLGEYHCAMCMVSLSRVYEHPLVKEVVGEYIDPNKGTSYAETRLAELYKRLEHLIGTRGIIKDNVLINFMETKSLKSNQIPQMMIAYGPRSDISDEIMHHVINESAMSGLKTIEDYATESLSAKKSSYFNKTVIKDTQYFARVLRLNSSNLIHMYSGSCGNKSLLPFIIPAKDVEQYIDKVVFLDGNKIIISEDNLDTVAGKTVEMISPTLCKHKDGVCAYCAGRGDMDPWAYMPPGIHLGIFAATKVGKAVSQMILSAKHLVKTNSIVFVLSPHAAKYLHVANSSIILHPKYTKLFKESSIKIACDEVGHLSDLTHGAVSEATFSHITQFTLVRADGSEEIIELNQARFAPYISKEFLKHIGNKLDVIDHSDDSYIIPLEGFNVKKPLFQFTVVNDDMVAFTREVDKLLSTKVSDFTSMANLLAATTSTIYAKTKINVFFIEVLLKTFIRNSDGTPGMGVVEDINDVTFGKMKDNIAGNSVTTKLGYERLGERDYFGDPATSVVEKGPGLYDPLFGVF